MARGYVRRYKNGKYQGRTYVGTKGGYLKGPGGSRTYGGGKQRTRTRGARRFKRKGRAFRDPTRQRITSLHMGKVPFPDITYCQLRTEQTIPLVGLTGLTLITLQANSLFDVFGASGTKQPLYFDQLALIYNRYRVQACRLSVFFDNTSATIATRLFTHIRSSDGVPLATFQQFMEQPYVKSRYISPKSGGNTGLGSSTLYGKTLTVEKRGSAGSEHDYEASPGANPSKIWKMVIATHDAHGPASTGAVNGTMHLVVTQYCKFFARKLVSDA